MSTTCRSYACATLRRPLFSKLDGIRSQPGSKLVQERRLCSSTVEQRGWLAAAISESTREADKTLYSRTSDDATEMKYAGKKALVIGAGPSGVVASAFLAKQGFCVKVYEKRGDPALAELSDKRSLPIDIHYTTTLILNEAIGLEIPNASNIFASGMNWIIGNGEMEPTHVDYVIAEEIDRPKFNADRIKLTVSITKATMDRYSEKIDINYNCDCKCIDFDRQKAEIELSDGKTIIEDYDLLVGADGVKSTVRSDLMKIDQSLTATKIDNSSCYKYIRGLSLLNQNEELCEKFQPGWSLNGTFSDSSSLEDKSPGVVVFINETEDGEVSASLMCVDPNVIEKIDKNWLINALPSYFPEVWIDELANRIANAPLSRIPSVCLVSKFDGPRTVIIGDAAHSVTPAMGVGANMAIKDGSELSLALVEADGDLDALPRIFHQRRFSAVRSQQILQIMAANAGMQLTGIHWLRAAIGGIHQRVCEIGHKRLPRIIPATVLQRSEIRELSPMDEIVKIYRDLVIGAATLFLIATSVAESILPIAN